MRILTVFLLWLTAMAFVQAHAEIRSVAVAGDGDLTRLTIETGSDSEGDVFLSLADGQPVIEFVPSDASVSPDAYLGQPTGAVIAYTLNSDRVSFELSHAMMVMRELAPPPEAGAQTRRFIIDLTRVSSARYNRAAKRDAKRLAAALSPAREPTVTLAAATPSATETVSPEAQPSAPPSLKPWGLDRFVDLAQARKKVIVIDPGHGGRDPGTSSIVGGQEKTIVLSASLVLKDYLSQDARYDVYLTRTTDIYVDHEDRVSKARDWGADLFISMHVDASGSPRTDGASVYSIDTKGERRKEGAARDNGWHMKTGEAQSAEVEGILKDLIKRETKSNSAIFAELVLPELAQAGPLLKNPFRRDNLAVLLAPDVPAVLIELGFITNSADAKRLKSKRGQQKAAKAIKRAIDAYFDRQDLILAAN
ncbi:N-acetylmuramoyl-L-alanine amidase [Hyphomonas sp. FCG-A18]|uniref:N-acetylmuramoyl-L-alanine amidase family protein n=1 Tax=Hyphomonas sp. FCG-A18 TaxID=3080019 RepID=UPI002B2B635C|nr:N-acetylmuramoyl-L-alanine amidase [Hyphomonas sp. FCG-A18]